MATTPAEKSLRGRAAAHTSWGNTLDRTARTAKARNAFENKFLTKADGDPTRAESLRRAYYARLALKSAKARKRRRETEKAARQDRIAALLQLQADDGGAA